MLSHQVLRGLNEAIEFWWCKAKFSLPFPLESDALLQPLSCEVGPASVFWNKIFWKAWGIEWWFLSDVGQSWGLVTAFSMCVSPWTLPRSARAALDSASQAYLCAAWLLSSPTPYLGLLPVCCEPGPPLSPVGTASWTPASYLIFRCLLPWPCTTATVSGGASCFSWHWGLSHQHQTLVWRRTCASAKLFDTLHNQGKHFYCSLSRPCCPKFPFTSAPRSFQRYFSWSYPAAVPELTASCSVDPTGSPSRREGGLPFSPKLTAF